MATRPWTVFKPGPLTPLDENLWLVTDQVPGIPGATRCMTILRRADQSLVFYNAIPLPDATLDEVKKLGTPRDLIIPNQFHALDAAAFAHRLGLTAYAPDVAVQPLADRLTCKPGSQLALDEGFRTFTVDGFRTKELIVFFRGTLIVADLVTNAPHVGGFNGFIMKLIGFTGPEPKLPKPVRKRVGRDLPAVKTLLEELAALPGLTRVVPSHGGVISTAPSEALRRIAASL
jgi:hypothetical protein